MNKLVVFALFALLTTSVFAGRFAEQREAWNNLSDDEKTAIKHEAKDTSSAVKEDLSNKYDRYNDLSPKQKHKVENKAEEKADDYRNLSDEEQQAVKEKAKDAGKRYLQQF